MVRQTLVYEGQLRARATHTPSGTVLIADAPVDNHGKGESFSATDLVVTALGTCKLLTMGIAAQRDGVSIDGATANVEKHMSSDPPRRIARLVVQISFPAGIPLDYRVKLERTARGCPVARSLSSEIEIEASFSYPD
jgi:putative redox protein